MTRNATAATALSGRVDRRSASTLLSNPHPLLIRTSLALALAVYTFARVIGSSVQPGPRGPGALLPAAMPLTAQGLAGP